mmetsp:Transcript_12872/g.34674  ORF Transcript_12872/g.34674 Transcript_12872/m.34674 type:complete len:216 (+) Transcript_12872:493-1140(+)
MRASTDSVPRFRSVLRFTSCFSRIPFSGFAKIAPQVGESGASVPVTESSSWRNSCSGVKSAAMTSGGTASASVPCAVRAWFVRGTAFDRAAPHFADPRVCSSADILARCGGRTQTPVMAISGMLSSRRDVITETGYPLASRAIVAPRGAGPAAEAEVACRESCLDECRDFPPEPLRVPMPASTPLRRRSAELCLDRFACSSPRLTDIESRERVSP